ncbi:hypothetical protein ES703_37570 [subsurface metagenome]
MLNCKQGCDKQHNCQHRERSVDYILKSRSGLALSTLGTNLAALDKSKKNNRSNRNSRDGHKRLVCNEVAVADPQNSHAQDHRWIKRPEILPDVAEPVVEVGQETGGYRVRPGLFFDHWCGQERPAWHRQKTHEHGSTDETDS